jgi:hypothetical protein
MQRHLENAKRGRVPHDAVRGNRRDRSVICTACADGELAYAVHWVGYSGRCLRSEALIDVVMAIEDHVSVGGVQLVPQLQGVGAAATAGAE